MNFSAASSSSPVVTPSRTLPSRRSSVRTRMSPAAAILSMSAGDFLTIIAGSQLVFEPQGGDRRPDVVVHLRRGPRAVEAPQQPAVLVEGDQRLGLRVVDVEALLDGLGRVVVALEQL